MVDAGGSAAPKEVGVGLFTARSPSCTDRFPATKAKETMSTSDYSLLYVSAHRLRPKLSKKRPLVPIAQLGLVSVLRNALFEILAAIC